MKKFILSGLFLITCYSAIHAQTIYTGDGTLSSARTVELRRNNLTFQPVLDEGLFINGDTGDVGIGTTTPNEKLHVDGNIEASVGIFTNSQPAQTFTDWVERNYKCMVLAAGTSIDPAQRSRVFNFFDFPDSNIAPAQVMLDIQDRSEKSRFRFDATQDAGSELNIYNKLQSRVFQVTDDGSDNVSVAMQKPNSRIVIGAWLGYEPGHKLVVTGSSLTEGNVFANANVGIGTTSFTDGADTYRLSVNGNIRANRVKVYTTWADYVFEDDYKLPTLEEVEQHINDKGHLKDIPSAAQVKANGIDVGEMNKLLLQKIEELTLYTIQLNKELQEVKAKLNQK